MSDPHGGRSRRRSIQRRESTGVAAQDPPVLVDEGEQSEHRGHHRVRLERRKVLRNERIAAHHRPLERRPYPTPLTHERGLAGLQVSEVGVLLVGARHGAQRLARPGNGKLRRALVID